MMGYAALVVFCLLHFCNGWVFTDVKFPLKIDGEVWNSVDEIPPEEIQNILKRKKLSLTYLGTKWCGPGNTAENDNDLGMSLEADKCCRQHDKCPDIIPGGETKYNLTNAMFYSRLRCDCDEIFRKCLRDANTETADMIGRIYFDSINTMCFREDYPVIKCQKTSGWLLKKCVKYSYDVNGRKLYQWFDVSYY